MKIELSVLIITYNEERNIARCIDSVVGISSDILVVDSYSTDRTKAICIEKGVRFIEHSFEGHIEQKNFAVSQAKKKYILSLDADECLSPVLNKAIVSCINNWQYDSYSFNRLTNYCGSWIKHCGWYPDKKLRLWNASKGSWGGVNPHDQIIMQKNTTTKHINLDLLHYSFYTVEQHLKQIKYFTDISSKAAFKIGKKSSYFKIFYKSTFKFISDYFFKLGFLDGYYGFIVCKNSALAKGLKYLKLKNLNQNK